MEVNYKTQQDKRGQIVSVRTALPAQELDRIVYRVVSNGSFTKKALEQVP